MTFNFDDLMTEILMTLKLQFDDFNFVDINIGDLNFDDINFADMQKVCFLPRPILRIYNDFRKISNKKSTI